MISRGKSEEDWRATLTAAISAHSRALTLRAKIDLEITNFQVIHSVGIAVFQVIYCAPRTAHI